MFEFLQRGKEKFLLLEIAPKRTSGLLLGVDKDKNIRLEKFWEDFSFKKIHGDPLKALRKRQVIASANSDFVTNVIAPVSLERDRASAERPITLPELENLFAQAIGRMHAQHRGEASKHLDLDELDTVLVGARASDYKIDDHLVLNPLGFHGKNVSAILELTFAARTIFDDLKEFFKAREGFFFTNLPRAALFALSRVNQPPLGLLSIDGGRSFCFMLDKTAWGHSIKEAKFNWSLGGIFEAIARGLSVSPEITFAVYDKFLNNETSNHFSNSLERTLKPEKEKLFAELRKLNPRGRIYVHADAPLPFNYPVSVGRAALDELPTEEALRRFGFRLEEKNWPFSKSETLMRLAPFFEFYFDKSDSEINRRLRRRLHWLIQ